MIARLPRSLLSLVALAVATATSANPPQLMQGPMLGQIEPTSAKIWARVAGEADFSVLYSKSPSFANAQRTASVRAQAKNDYCVEVVIEGLSPSSFYYYQALVNGVPLQAPREREGYPLLTAPAPNRPARFSVGFGAGAKTELDGLQAIWLQVQNARPHAFFWLGDNESAEGLSPAFQAEQYRTQRSVTFLQPLLRSIPQLATWDGSKTSGQAKSLEVFRRYWANPAYGTETNPGTYFIYQYGGVDFIFLDTYSFRQGGAEATLLGAEQMEWLKVKLASSQAPFKVLLSSSSWTGIKDEPYSSWTAFPDERDELFSLIHRSNIGGVILVSGDNQQAEVNAIPLSDIGGYDLYELVSSPLAQDPIPSMDDVDPSTISIHAPYANSMNFGLLTFDIEGDDPSFTFELIDIFGNSVFPTLALKASELTNGHASWQTKVDDPEAYAQFIESQRADPAL